MFIMPGKEKREGESTRQRGAPRFSPPAERVKPDACETPNTVIIAVMTCIYIYLYLYLSRAVCPPEKATRALYSRHTYKVHTHRTAFRYFPRSHAVVRARTEITQQQRQRFRNDSRTHATAGRKVGRGDRSFLSRSLTR